ncbi:MAG: sugar ABC transporter permease [Lachnospiraceae bacterium]
MIRVRKDKKRVPYMFMSPALIMISIVFLYPIISVLIDSFFQISGQKRTYTGIQNFRVLLENDLFWKSLINNMKFFICVPILIILGIVFAVLLYNRIPGWKIYRVLLLVPYIFSIAVTGIIFDCILRENGLFNILLEKIGLGHLVQPWLGQTSTAVYAIMAVIVWKEMGFGTMLILARLLSVDESMVEAARLDGAGIFTITRKILLPEAKPVISFYFVLCMINMLSWLFNYVYVMTKGGPVNSTYVMDFYIYQLGVKFVNYGMASALAVVLLIITFLLVGVQAAMQHYVFPDEED